MAGSASRLANALCQNALFTIPCRYALDNEANPRGPGNVVIINIVTRPKQINVSVTDARQIAEPGSRKDADEAIARELLAIVQTLAEELRPQLRRAQTVTLDSNLDRDLGLDSLGRAELLHRLDDAFKVRLPDRLLGDAETPRDLMGALRAAGPAIAERTATPPADAIDLKRVEAPATAATLIDVLGFHAGAHPDRPHILLWRSETREDPLSYGDLHAAALRVAAGLVQRDVSAGDRVAIMLPTERAFFEAFFGTLYAGGIPVPVYPPMRRSQIEDHLRRQAGILENAGASVLIIAEELRNVGSLLIGLTGSLKTIETVSKLAEATALDAPVPAHSETVALIQYTSGSTGDPKGVVLTHANLLANIRAMGTALDADSDDVFVSWLPLYHDMGLIGAWLGSLYFAAVAVILPPLAFLADPGRWLRAISRHRATLSAAPNFAFELCCKRLGDDDVASLDLRSLRLIANGSEPVSPATIARFAERFAGAGFRPEMMAPVYGLAENSVGLAFPPPGRGPVIERINRQALSRDGQAVPAEADDRTALSVVACGRPIPGHQIRIVDDADRELPDRRQGRLQFKGPSATAGYYRNTDKNRSLFRGDWLESGDLAYLANGDVFITGRIKDIIIKAGRNIYPHEIEALVGQIDGVRKGCVAAVSSPDPATGTDRLIVVAETVLTEPETQTRLRRRITESCTVSLDMPPDLVVMVSPRTVPKTSSGKIRRAATRQLFEAGQLTASESGWRMQLFRLAVSAVGGRARRAWRTMAEFAFAAYWWLLLVTLAAVVWPLVIFLPSRNWRHRVVHLCARAFLRLTGAAPRIESTVEIPDTAAILVANHSSYLDALVIAAAVPGCLTFVAKGELEGQKIAGPFLRRLGAIFARRTAAAAGVEDTQRQRDAAREGARIMTFPEGTLTRMPGLLPFRLGAFVVAAQEGLPVVPITLRGTRSILRGEQWFPRHDTITVHVDKPLRSRGADFAAAVRLRDDVRAIILERCGEPDLGAEWVEIEPGREKP